MRKEWQLTAEAGKLGEEGLSEVAIYRPGGRDRGEELVKRGFGQATFSKSYCFKSYCGAKR
jgi:hypothetical protein